MKKQKQTEKKLSLKKLQMVKIQNGLNSVKGGSAVGGGGNDTILDNTLTTTAFKTVQTSLEIANNGLGN